MKHAPEPWLKKLNLAYTLFAALTAATYLGAKFIPALHFLLRWVGDSPVATIVAVLTVIYSLFLRQLVRKQNLWMSYFITYFMTILVGYLSVAITGDYTSHYFLIISAIAFFGGMIGLFASLVPFVLEIFGGALVLAGGFKNTSGPIRAIITIAITWAVSTLGWWVWRRYHTTDPNDTSMSKGLASMLNRERLQSEIILNAVDDGVIMVDREGVIRLFNPSAARLTGWQVTEATGIDYRSVIKLVDEKNNPYDDTINPFTASLTQGTPSRDNHAALGLKSGASLPVDISVSPLIDESRQLSGIVAIIRDVSKQRSDEQKRADFISTASHEMRTPVAAIEGYLALALNEHVSRIDSKARDYLEKAHASTQHLGKLFQDLLTSAKAEDGRLVSHPTAVEMGEFLEQLADSLRFSAEKRGLLTDFTIGTTQTSSGAAETVGGKVIRPLYYVHVDPDRLREVITNLFDNAVKYTEAGKVSLGLTGNDAVVQLYIKDTGPGIPAEDIPHLFQKFYRVDNSSTRTIGGTGLGLFICRKIVEMYNGRIWVESVLRQGSTFYINLPRITSQKAEELKQKEAAQSPLARL